MSDQPTHTEGNEPSEIAMLAKAQRQQRLKTLGKATGLILMMVLFFGGLYMLTASSGPVNTQDVSQEEQTNLSLTNDPQCRGLVEQITQFGTTFKAAVPQIEDVTSDDPEAIAAARKKVGELRSSLEKSRILSTQAELRYETSADELKGWFKHVDTELRLLDLRGEVKLKMLDAKAKGETYVEPTPKRRGRIMGEENKKKKSLEDRRDASVLAIFDEFRNFRIWHTAANHPCGAASQGETPWTPPAKKSEEKDAPVKK